MTTYTKSFETMLSVFEIGTVIVVERVDDETCPFKVSVYRGQQFCGSAQDKTVIGAMREVFYVACATWERPA